ncbi:MAG: hypothetical protein KDC87_08395 [Planctomycetes bacterium]|nr:hypothetical protein [Planctomycetota bacterium]MCB9871861.1 hypothetical protein [Planctomycetota bacterium]MCB9888811.1 hypothetical protein [Planctomycetota bacterium]
MIRYTRLALLAALFAAPLTAQTTYYVDQVGGADTNGGTLPSAAWRTLTYAAGSLQKGDTLVVLPGVYDLKHEITFPVNFGATATDQSNITIIAAEGPSKTFIDGNGSYSGIGMIRFQEMARGARMTGFTFRNMADAFWSCAIRLGSSSGDQYRAWDVEIDNCVFESTLSRPFVVFGASANTARQSSGMRIHNNLILNTNSNRRACEIYGDGQNWFYNNTIVHPTDIADRAVVWVNALLTHGQPGNARVFNNIIVGGGTSSEGIELGVADTTTYAGGANGVVLNNNCYNNKIDYKGFTPDASNLSADPMFVDTTKGDYRLQAGSPCLDTGSAAVAQLRHDLDYYPTLFPATARGRLPDIGAYEFHPVNFGLVAAPKVGGTVTFGFAGATPAMPVGVFLGFDEAAYGPLSFGLVLANPLFFLAQTVWPNVISGTLPNDPNLEGLRLVFQGAAVINGNVELLNVAHTYVRK